MRLFIENVSVQRDQDFRSGLSRASNRSLSTPSPRYQTSLFSLPFCSFCRHKTYLTWRYNKRSLGSLVDLKESLRLKNLAEDIDALSYML